MLNGLLLSGVAGGFAGGAAGGLLVQGLGNRKGRRTMGKAATLGGAAIIGGLAWKAYEQYRDRAGASKEVGGHAAGHARASGTGSASWQGITQDQFLPEGGSTAARRDVLVLRAIITAAHADGHIDTDERLKIYQRLENLELSPTERGFLMEEISAPLNLQQLVQQVPNRAMAAEVYLAALLMADTPAPAHRLFLHDLAEQLALPAGFVAAMHEEVNPGKPSRAEALPTPSPMVSPQA
jgi:uncharacterized membrane protein YebE (DUF533 family)